MKQIEIFCLRNIGDLQDSVNKFCEKHYVVDIQMTESENDISVMVVYEKEVL